MPPRSAIGRLLLFQVVALSFLLTSVPTSAQPQFSSAFTHLARDCQDAVKGEAAGEDIPQKCKGYGRYYVFIYYSAYGCHIAIKNQDNDEMIYLAPEQFDFSSKKDSVVEWRLANGQPFAVIIKVTKYNTTKAQERGDNPFQKKYKIGDVVLVKGLKGYGHLNYSLNAATTSDALAKARTLADQGYGKGR
uniref:Uncharacterized protein n=1 Tax=Desulfobacca acetoxidans TaxID=60893 RepID=A0A7V4LDI2_9BACT